VKEIIQFRIESCYCLSVNWK